MVEKFKMIPIHKRGYCLPNSYREPNEPQFFYDEKLQAYYVPSTDGYKHVWLTCPEILATKLNIGSTWDRADAFKRDGVTYFTAKSIGDAEALLKKANAEFLEFRIPKVRKKVILFSIDSDNLKISHEVCWLVHNNGKYYTLESEDGNARYSSKHMYSLNDVPEHLDYTPETDAWFKNASETVARIRFELKTLLNKHIYDDNGKLTGYGYFNAEDIKSFVAAGTLPIQSKYTALLGEGK